MKHVDKIKHLVIGAALGAASYLTFWGWGLLISSLIFVGKEYYDTVKKNPTGFDKADLFVDYLGFGIGFGAAGFIHGIIAAFI